MFFCWSTDAHLQILIYITTLIFSELNFHQKTCKCIIIFIEKHIIYDNCNVYHFKGSSEIVHRCNSGNTCQSKGNRTCGIRIWWWSVFVSSMRTCVGVATKSILGTVSCFWNCTILCWVSADLFWGDSVTVCILWSWAADPAILAVRCFQAFIPFPRHFLLFSYLKL